MGLFLDNPVLEVGKTIHVPMESYAYLRRIMHRQRCEDLESHPDISDDYFERLKKKYPYNKCGYISLMDYDLGGAKGNPKNAYEEGRWTDWTLDEMKQMLDEAGLPYEDGKETEIIHI